MTEGKEWKDWNLSLSTFWTEPENCDGKLLCDCACACVRERERKGASGKAKRRKVDEMVSIKESPEIKLSQRLGERC